MILIFIQIDLLISSQLPIDDGFCFLKMLVVIIIIVLIN